MVDLDLVLSFLGFLVVDGDDISLGLLVLNTEALKY